MDSPLSASTTLLNAQISFLDTHVALIHIPLAVYAYFTQPIAHLLLHNDRLDAAGQPLEVYRPWTFWQPFVNVSITTNECSIVCPRDLAQDLFAPIIAGLSSANRKDVSISKDDYSVIAIGGEGLEAGQRVLDLTGPLALAGIPIFFITSYWSDYILVPHKARSTVIHALEERGFVFEAEKDGEAGLMTNPASPLLHARHRNTSSISSFDFPAMPSTPPPTTVDELQSRTFRKLKEHKVLPLVHQDIELVTCAGIKDGSAASSAANFTQGKLQNGLLKVLTARERPQFFSLTLTDTESMSLTIEKRLLKHFPDDGEDLLLGKDGPEQVPITLDLRSFPMESTGIVCGVASRLFDSTKGRIGVKLDNLSYLSTSKGGHVIVYQDELEDVIGALHDVLLSGQRHVDGA